LGLDSDKLEEKLAKNYFRQIIRGVEYCHTSGVSHRDLKPENILIDENGKIKISDFGLSAFNKQFEHGPNLFHTTCGTLNFIAPEIIKNTGYDGAAADVWACGVILYHMLTGQRPFEEESVHKLLDKIVIGEFKFPEKHNLKPGVMDLITAILNPNPRKRYTLEQIKETQWFQEDGYEEDPQLKELIETKKRIN
jgi:5'-AMP-activated protein kinase catalytic alpha subunit